MRQHRERDGSTGPVGPLSAPVAGSERRKVEALRVQYHGPFGAVHIPSLGLEVQAGDPIDVDDDQAAELLARGDWSPAAAPPVEPVPLAPAPPVEPVLPAAAPPVNYAFTPPSPVSEVF